MSSTVDAQLGTAFDAVLVERMSRGDQQSLGELRARHAGTVYAVVYAILGNPMQSEHVLSETFLEAWRSAAERRPEIGGGSVHSWLTGIARRRARDARGTPLRLSPRSL